VVLLLDLLLTVMAHTVRDVSCTVYATEVWCLILSQSALA